MGGKQSRVLLRRGHKVCGLTCDGVRLGYQSRETPADGVTLVTWSACRAWTAGTGVTGVRLLHTSLVPADVSVLTLQRNMFWT